MMSHTAWFLAALFGAVASFAQGSAPNLVYSRRLGGEGVSQALGMARGPNGHSFITGNTTAKNLATPGAFQTNFTGTMDAFVAELDQDGQLIFLSYLGGTGAQSGQSIAVDQFGNIYVAGNTSSTNFPTLNALQGQTGGKYDAFVTKFAAGGSNLVFSTYLGGQDMESANSIALDSVNNPIITGYTQSTNYPTVLAFQPVYGGNGDAFVTKVAADGSSLFYSTYLGGNSYENGPGFLITSQTALIPATGGALDVGSDGSAYVTGWTYSTNLPVSSAFQPRSKFLFSGGSAAYVAKLDPAGHLVYSTYFGGELHDAGYAIGVDADNNVYFGGSCLSGDLPVTHAYQSNFAGGPSSFLAALDASGTNLIYCTYLGGASEQQINGIAVRSDGVVVATGTTTSRNFPSLNAIQDGPTGFLSSTNGGRIWNTLNTGPGNSALLELAVDPFNSATLYAIADGLYQSSDRGQHWTLINDGVPGGLRKTGVNLLAFDTAHAGTFYYGGFAAVYKTADRGAHWTSLANAPSPSAITALALDPNSPTTLYAGTYLNGIFKSVNGGTNWTDISGSLANQFVRALLVDPGNSSNVFAGVDNDFSAALFRSTNGGNSWSAITTLPSFEQPAVALAATPAAPSYIYGLLGDFGESALVIETTNGGRTWTQPLQMLNGMINAAAVAPALQPKLSIAEIGRSSLLSWPASSPGFSLQTTAALGLPWQNVPQPPASDGILNTSVFPESLASSFYRLSSTNNAPAPPWLYVGCDQNGFEGLLASSDGGQSWRKAGLVGDAIHTVAADPADAQTVYVGAANTDAFISTFTPAGQLYFSTCIGGSGLDAGNAVVAAGSGVVVAGLSASPEFPPSNPSTRSPDLKALFVVPPLGVTTPPIVSDDEETRDVSGILMWALGNALPCAKDRNITIHATAGNPVAEEANPKSGSGLVISASGALPPGVSNSKKTDGSTGAYEIRGVPSQAGTFKYVLNYLFEDSRSKCPPYTVTIEFIVSPP